MADMNFEKLELILKCMSDFLKTFDGSVYSKKKYDEAYLSLLDIVNNIKSACNRNNISLEDAKKLEISVNYNLDLLNNLKLERDNLILDF